MMHGTERPYPPRNGVACTTSVPDTCRGDTSRRDSRDGPGIDLWERSDDLMQRPPQGSLTTMPEHRRRRIRSDTQAFAFLLLVFGVVFVTSVATGSLLALAAFAGGALLALLHELLRGILERRDPP